MLPTTTTGRWSLLAITAFALLIAVFGLLVASGQRGGEGFFDNLWLTVPFLGAYIAAVAALVLGVVAMMSSGERSVTVILAIILGFFVALFGILEVVFPH